MFNTGRTSRNLLLPVSVILFLVLLFSFKENVFRIVKHDRFLRIHSGAQTLIEAKLADRSEGKTLFEGGLLRGNAPLFRGNVDKCDPNLSERYNSQFGLQGLTACLIQLVVGLEVKSMMQLGEWIVAGALALAFGLFFYCLAARFGLAAALPGAMLVLFSTHLLLMARNVYWLPFLLFLPSIVAHVLCPKALENSQVMRLLLASTFVVILCKCLCGYEFVTNLVLSASPVLLFWGLIKNEGVVKIFSRQATFFLLGVAAFLAALVIHLVFLGISLGGLGEAWAAVAERASHNTFNGDSLGERSYAVKYLEPGSGLVLLIFKLLSFNALNLGFYPSFGEQEYYVFRFAYWGLVALASILCIPGWLVFLRRGGWSKKLDVWMAVSLSLPWSFICSLSWVIAARGHSIEQMELGVIYFLFPFIVHFWFCLAVLIKDVLDHFLIRPAEAGQAGT
jgi:hypothetical protein